MSEQDKDLILTLIDDKMSVLKRSYLTENLSDKEKNGIIKEISMYEKLYRKVVEI